MTLRELIQTAGAHPMPVGAVLLGLPVLAWLTGLAHGQNHGQNTPWKYLYSVWVYLACIPGTFAAVLTAYALFFRNESLLDVNLLIYFLPIATMIVTLVLIRRRVAFEAVPGFDRLSGLLTLMACSFALALAIQRTRIFVGFFGSIEMLFALAGGTFALLKWGGWMLFRRRNEPAKPPPSFPVP